MSDHDSEEGRTHYDNFPRCPYCGHRYQDAWELFEGDDDTNEIECGKCEKKYQSTSSVSITYISKPLENPK